MVRFTRKLYKEVNMVDRRLPCSKLDLLQPL